MENSPAGRNKYYWTKNYSQYESSIIVARGRLTRPCTISSHPPARRCMPRTRTLLEVAAGKLISAIQREWSAEAGGSNAEISENVMHRLHSLLQAAKHGSIIPIIATCSISDFLGKRWVNAHPRVWPHIQVLESLERGAASASQVARSK